MDTRTEDFLASKNEGTQTQYRRAFQLFKQYTESKLGGELTGGALVRSLAEDRRKDIEDRRRPEVKLLKGFFDWLRSDAPHRGGKRGMAIKTAYKYLSGLTEFLRFNDLPVNKKRLNLPRPTGKKKNQKINIRREQVASLVDHAKTNRDKALLLCQWQSGMSIGDLLSLNVSDVLAEDPFGGSLDDPPLLVKLIRQKAGIEYRTFFGRDACEALKRYMAERERRQGELKRDSPLFTHERKRREKGKKERRYNRLDPGAVDMMIRRVVERSGLISRERLKEADLNPARSHALRAGFSSVLKEEGVNESIVNGLMGHAVGYDSAYNIFSDKQLRELYQRHEDVLSIGQISIPREEEIEAVVKKHFGELGVERVMSELKARFADFERRERREIEELKEKYRKFEERRTKSDDVMTRLFKDKEFRDVFRRKVTELGLI